MKIRTPVEALEGMAAGIQEARGREEHLAASWAVHQGTEQVVRQMEREQAEWGRPTVEGRDKLGRVHRRPVYCCSYPPPNPVASKRLLRPSEPCELRVGHVVRLR